MDITFRDTLPARSVSEKISQCQTRQDLFRTDCPERSTMFPECRPHNKNFNRHRFSIIRNEKWTKTEGHKLPPTM